MGWNEETPDTEGYIETTGWVIIYICFSHFGILYSKLKKRDSDESFFKKQLTYDVRKSNIEMMSQ